IEALRGWDPWAPQLFAYLADTGRLASGIPVIPIPTVPPTVNFRVDPEKTPTVPPPFIISGTMVGGKAVKRTRRPDTAGITLLNKDLGFLYASVRVRVARLFTVRTFGAAVGQPGPLVYIARNPETVRYLHYLHPPGLSTFGLGLPMTPPFDPEDDISEYLGPPLILGSDLIATAASDLLLVVRPFAPDDQKQINLRVSHVSPTLPGRAANQLRGYPPLPVSRGFFLGDDTLHRFVGSATTGGDAGGAWHQELDNRLGLAVTDGNRVYFGIGGPTANQGIVALNGASGRQEWLFPPAGVRRELPDANPFKAGGEVALSGHWSHPGLVLARDHVYGEVQGALVCLDRRTGEQVWRRPLPANATVYSLIASRDHLLACVSAGGPRGPAWTASFHKDNTLLALRLKDGKPVWTAKVDRPGNLQIADGMLYLANGGLIAFGPAERTFKLAVDSDHRADYRASPLRQPEDPRVLEGEPVADLQPGQPEPEKPGQPEQPGRPGEAGPPPPGAVVALEPPAPAKERAVGDASTLWLLWAPEAELLARARARRQALPPGTPLLLTLDRLSPERDAWLDGARPFTPAWVEEYVEVCRKLAAAVRPEHFNLLPEIDAYLTRFPSQAGAVQELVAALVPAIHQASPGTKVAVSFNCEILAGRYSRGDYRPFGKLALPGRLKPAELLAVAAAADEIGWTSYPQAAFTHPGQMPGDYYFLLRRLVRDRPVLFTRAAVRLEQQGTVGPELQAGFLGRFFLGTYWLDAPVICYPDLIAEEGARRDRALALRVGETDRLALAVWQRVLHWSWVDQLTLGLQPPDPNADPPDPNAPPDDPPRPEP
ncbi:MAG TPA: PQQ-binding-like beta-propeller repeat protein, partial [Armatimonadota bacterium]|nr:PQQ-binding-like beta-propeller repeat protein [Armatimonadota bacterium]